MKKYFWRLGDPAAMIAAFILVFIGTGIGYCQEMINLKYLDSQKTTIKLSDGISLTFWKTSDSELLNKGIAASTMENALTAMVYLRHYELYKEGDSLNNAFHALKFLYYMQGKEGAFNRYIDDKGTILNKDSSEECNFAEHSAYAFWALGEGARIIRSSHPGNYNRLEEAFLQTLSSLKMIVKDPNKGFGNYTYFQKMKIPAWLIESRGDISSIYLLGMSRFCEDVPLHSASEIAKDLGQGIMEFKHIENDVFPQHAHLTFTDQPNILKTTNAFQTASLAYGGKTFQRRVWITEAEKAAAGFLLHLVTSYGPMEGFYPHPDIYPQFPLGAFTLTLNFIAMHHTTGNDDYAKIAGLSAGWFLRNNLAKSPLYSPEDGSCYKQINKSGIIQEKSLIGSAAALLSLMALEHTTGKEYVHHKPEYTHAFHVLESEEGKPVNQDFKIMDWEYSHEGKGQVVVIRQNNTFWHKFKVDFADDYFMMLSFQKQLLYSSAVAVNVRIDGGPILLVPLGGAIDEPYMVMKRVTEPVHLKPGLHTVGVRYKGLLLTKPAIIDCSVLQPVLQRKKFVSRTGKNLILVKNFNPQENKTPLFTDIKDESFTARGRSILGEDVKDLLTVYNKDRKYLVFPKEGFGIVEW